LALALAACGGSFVSPSPTPTPQPLTLPQLKYSVMDEIGRPLFCDPDFYPIARADERELAQQRVPEIQKDAATFAAIVAHLQLPPATYTPDQQLAIYREWKTLNAIQLQPINDVWAFAYVAQKTDGSVERVDVSLDDGLRDGGAEEHLAASDGLDRVSKLLVAGHWDFLLLPMVSHASSPNGVVAGT